MDKGAPRLFSAEPPTYADTAPLSQPDVRQRRVLQTIIADGSAEPPNLMFNPAWSKTRRTVCVVCGVFGLLIFLVLLIAIIVGFITALLYIQERERIKQIGLFMIPNVIDNTDDAMMHYKGVADASDSEGRKIVDGYVAEIENFLKPYYDPDGSAVDCSQGGRSHMDERCRFNVETLGTNCTRENKFGYYSGSPCFLLGVRNIKFWTPSLDQEYLKYSVESVVGSHRRKSLNVDHVPVHCRLPNHYWFSDSDQPRDVPLSFFPDAGFQMSFLTQNATGKQLPPLVFVQMNNFANDTFKRVECEMFAKNMDSLVGVKKILFGTTSVDAM